MYDSVYALRKGNPLDEVTRLDIYSEALADIMVICQLALTATAIERLGLLTRIKVIVTDAVEESLLGLGV